MTFPTQARFVVIGGGIIGCSTAYHLAKFGAKDVVLLERHQLTSGTSFHAAGLVGQLRSSANITRLLKYSVELYRTLEQTTGQATGWKMNGGLRLACNAERMAEIKRQATTAHSFGLDMHLLSPDEAKKIWPPMDASDLVGAAFLPTDGQANPSDITMALAAGARREGARIIEGADVTGIHTERGRVTGVQTNTGNIACEAVVICAGQWSGEIGRMAGVVIPVQSVEHQYLITEACGVPRDLPTLRDPDRLIYYKEEVGGFVMGGYELNPIPWGLDGLPHDSPFSLLDGRWDHFEPLMKAALARTPVLETAGVKTLMCGPEAFTPDGNFILGEAPEVKNFFVGCGFNAFGIASAGGAGWALAQWILEGQPPLDLWPVDIRRFAPSLHGDARYVRERTLEAYSKHYTMAWPHEEYASMRPWKTSRLYPKLKSSGACFGSKLGWERPNWYAPPGAPRVLSTQGVQGAPDHTGRAAPAALAAKPPGPPGVEPKDIYTYGRPNWFDHVAAEHRAARERVALFDQSSFAKFEVRGRDAEAALSWIAANDVTRPPGQVTYTQLLNPRGGIECDLTISRFAPELYFIVTGTGFRTHDLAWIRNHVTAGLDAQIADITDDWGCLALMGPRARVTLQAGTNADLSNPAFPFAACREIVIAGVTVRALRLTYVGELGWELHMPIDGIEAVHDALMSAGAAHGIANGGYRAIESLRLEKGYRAWGADINADSTPYEAGLGFAVKLNTAIPFLGREALEKQRKAPLKRMLATFTVKDLEVVLLGRETIFRDGAMAGYLTSGGFGHTLGCPIGMGYVRNDAGVNRDFVLSGAYELEVACERVPAAVRLLPLYDPDNARIKA